MKIDLIADIHLKEEYLPYQESELYKCFNKTKGEYLFILGDIFDDRKKVFASTQASFLELLETVIVNRYKEVFIVTGNHDKQNDDDEISFNTVYRNIKNVTICDTFTSAKVDGLGYCLFAPFFTDKKYDESFKAIKEVARSKHDFIFSHKTIPGLKSDSGRRSTGNLKCVKYLNKHKKVFLGDTHRRQEINNVVVVGSFFQERFGEIGNKGLLTYDVETNKIEESYIVKPFYKDLFYNLDDFPAKEIFLDCEKRIEMILKLRRKLGEFYCFNLRINLVGEQSEIMKFPDYEIKNRYKQHFNILKIKADFKEDKIILESQIFEEQRNFMQDFEDYCKEEKMNERQRIFGRKILKENNVQ